MFPTQSLCTATGAAPVPVAEGKDCWRAGKQAGARIRAWVRLSITHLQLASGTPPCPPGLALLVHMALLFPFAIRLQAWLGHSLLKDKTNIRDVKHLCRCIHCLLHVLSSYSPHPIHQNLISKQAAREELQAKTGSSMEDLKSTLRLI